MSAASCARDPRPARARRDRRDLLGPGHQRGELPDAEADAGGDRHQQRRQLLAHLPRALGRRADREPSGCPAAPTPPTTSTRATASCSPAPTPPRPTRCRRADRAAGMRGARLVVVDPRRTELARLADVHLRGRPGLQRRRVQRAGPVAARRGAGPTRSSSPLVRTGSTSCASSSRGYPPGPRGRADRGVPPDCLARGGRGVRHRTVPAIVYGLGVTEHVHGTDGVRTLANLAILRGAVGHRRGGGVNPLRGQNNVQGASDMGALPDLLPGYQRVDGPGRRGPRSRRRLGPPVPDAAGAADPGDVRRPRSPGGCGRCR